MTTFLPEPHLLGSPRRRDWPGAPPRPGHRRPGRGDDVPPARCSVAVVGAGPAGLAVAAALWHLDVRDVVLLDAGERVCGRFLDRCDVLRQRVLRVHAVGAATAMVLGPAARNIDGHRVATARVAAAAAATVRGLVAAGPARIREVVAGG